MGYDLGIDLGGTAVAAAIANGTGVETLTLGDRTAQIPAVAFRSEDGSLLFGDAAARRGAGRPDRVGRELKRRLRGGTPVRLGDTFYAVTDLLGALLQDTVARASETVGSKPDTVVLAHPAYWDDARRDVFGEIPRAAGLAAVRTVTEPEAVAAHYAAAGHFADGETVAVYDLGGGTFDATVLHRDGDRIEILGTPDGIERLGGGNFDEAVLSHVDRAAGGVLAGLDMRDPQNAAAVARLRQDCMLAKETLSTDTEAEIDVLLPHRHLGVGLTRADFEAMIRTPIETTIMTLIRTVQSAQLEPQQLSAIVLVGGSSRIPLVARMISDALARPIVLDAQSAYAVALGAAASAPARATAPAAVVDAANGPVERAEAQVPGPLVGRNRELVAASVAAATASVAHRSPVTEPDDRRPRWSEPDPTSLFEPATRAQPSDAPSPGRSETPVEDSDNTTTDTATDNTATTALTHTPAPARAVEPEAGTALPAPVSDPEPVTPLSGHRPTAPAAGSEGPALNPFLGVPTSELRRVPADVPPSLPVPPLLEPAPAAGGRRPRKVLISVAAAVAVLALVGVGYLTWSRVPTAARSAAPTATQPAAAPDQQAAGAQPVAVARSVPNPTVAATVQVGDTPGFVVVSPDGRQAMIARQDAGTITVLDTATNTVTATIPVAAGPPQYLSYSPDGRTVYVSIWNQARTIAAVGVLDTATEKITTAIPVRTRPYLSAVTPDGKRLYVPNHDSGTISVIDTTDNTVTSEITVAPNPHWVEMAGDGTRAYVANHESNLVSVIDTSNDSIVAQVPVQASPHSLAVHPTRPLVANVNYDAASVTMIDTNTEKVTAAVAVGEHPQDITWAPDGRFAYVVNTGDNTVSVIDAETAKVTATIPVGASPTSVSVLPSGTEAYVTNLRDGTVTVLDIDG